MKTDSEKSANIRCIRQICSLRLIGLFCLSVYAKLFLARRANLDFLLPKATMQIILDQLPIPDKGTFEICQTVTLHVSAEEARKTVSRWLFNHVSMLIGAATPTLFVGERATWRVPIWIGFPHTGRHELNVDIEVDAETGEMFDLANRKVCIEERATEVGKAQPPYKPRKTPSEFVAKNLPITFPRG